ncbi:hypothetical protein B7R57_05255 [Staphylococcus aureus]|nr:hypothetical protein B7473_10115 [Staphylococcus aureus]AUJ57634.1 hypothetical protein B7474_10120 [Staphylococcus aureus]AUW98573.1 hypothetical protein B7R57_05255 [Staphylococcus aureus]RBL75377.1 hypothetical protein B7472_10595 [Staphylococcus aureus]RBL75462.1 hypothetical protein B4O96_08285 [Staphylococcus aureus]
MLGPRQLALPVEFLFEILCVGAPPTNSNISLWSLGHWFMARTFMAI